MIKRLQFFLIISVIVTNLMAADEIGIYEKLDEYIPDGIELTDETGQKFMLKEKIDKPTVIALVYYNCPGICSPLLDGVAEVIDRADMVLGKDYQVMTISFNWNESWELARDKKVNYLKQIKKEIDEDSWRFVTGDSINVEKLVKSLGFAFKKEGEDFIHAATLIVLSPDGKITRYLHGTYFLPFDLKMAVVEAQSGKSGPTINKVLKYCFSYDAEGKQYVFNITKVGGSAIIFFAVLLFLFLALTGRKSKKEAKHIE